MLLSATSFNPSARYKTANKKDTVGLHVTMNDVLCMQIAENETEVRQDIYIYNFFFFIYWKNVILKNLLHALSCLPGDVHELDHLEVCLQDMNVFVEAAALTPLGHNGQVVLRHVAHEQQDVDMSCFPATEAEGKRKSRKTKIRKNFVMKMIHQ